MKIVVKRRHWILFALLFACNLLGLTLTFLHRGTSAFSSSKTILILLLLLYLIAMPFVTAILIVNLLEAIFERSQRR
jgi:hypothetical protein